MQNNAMLLDVINGFLCFLKQIMFKKSVLFISNKCFICTMTKILFAFGQITDKHKLQKSFCVTE